VTLAEKGKGGKGTPTKPHQDGRGRNVKRQKPKREASPGGKIKKLLALLSTDKKKDRKKKTATFKQKKRKKEVDVKRGAGEGRDGR